ncbi:MAG: hypothetical protein HQM09_14430, partial [Candidatus Riflebacteria bacterium]|nr:hypothetical protein [Candidatus Riflebacteria bacterium]
MTGFELYHLYIGCLVFGVGYAVVVAMLGAVGGHDGGGGHDFGVHHADSGGDAGHVSGGPGAASDPGMSMFSPLMMATFATVFGGLGLITLGLFGTLRIVPASVASIVSLLIAISLAFVLSSYFSFFLVRVFVKT